MVPLLKGLCISLLDEIGVFGIQRIWQWWILKYVLVDQKHILKLAIWPILISESGKLVTYEKKQDFRSFVFVGS